MRNSGPCMCGATDCVKCYGDGAGEYERDGHDADCVGCVYADKDIGAMPCAECDADSSNRMDVDELAQKYAELLVAHAEAQTKVRSLQACGESVARVLVKCMQDCS